MSVSIFALPGRFIRGHAMSAEGPMDFDIPEPITHKHCSGCNTTREVEHFSPNRQRRDGYQSWCKDCTAACLRARRKRLKEPVAQVDA